VEKEAEKKGSNEKKESAAYRETDGKEQAQTSEHPSTPSERPEHGAEKKAGTAAKEPEPGMEFPLDEGIMLARENSKQRKFEQTWDFIINLKGMDLKKPENRFNAEMPLPKGKGKKPRVAVFADLMAGEAGKFADLVITKKEIAELASNRKKMKKIANEHDFFFGEAPLMPEIGKSLGTVLGPRGKVPKPIPPKGNIEPLLQASRRMVRITLKETPVVYAVVGAEKMSDQDVADNARAVYNFVVEKLPKGKNNVKSVMIKTTMGRPIRVSMK
jgi:large subunit ribosomal protein L1